LQTGKIIPATTDKLLHVTPLYLLIDIKKLMGLNDRHFYFLIHEMERW